MHMMQPLWQAVDPLGWKRAALQRGPEYKKKTKHDPHLLKKHTDIHMSVQWQRCLWPLFDNVCLRVPLLWSTAAGLHHQADVFTLSSAVTMALGRLGHTLTPYKKNKKPALAGMIC